jgi:hypothetical protein
MGCQCYDKDVKTIRALSTTLAALAAVVANADPQSLELAKASARRVAEATCPLAHMVASIGKMETGTPGYQALQLEIDKESKSLLYLKAEETEKLRVIGPQLTNKEGRELNEYIDTVLSKTCSPGKS